MKFYDVTFSAIGDGQGPEVQVCGDDENRWLRLGLAEGQVILLLPAGRKGMKIVGCLADQLNAEVEKADAKRQSQMEEALL